MSALLFNFNSQHRRNGKWMAQWELLAKSYALDLMAYTNGNGLSKKPPVDRLFPSIEHAQEQVEGVEWVFLVAPGKPARPVTALQDFKHPAKAVYVLGPDYEELELNGRKMDHCVRVEVPNGAGELHALTVAAIVAYDRWRKIGAQ